MARASTAHSAACSSPGLLPADLLGTNIFHQPTGEFWFIPGPHSEVVRDEEPGHAANFTGALISRRSDYRLAAVLVIATVNPLRV